MLFVLYKMCVPICPSAHVVSSSKVMSDEYCPTEIGLLNTEIRIVLTLFGLTQR